MKRFRAVLKWLALSGFCLLVMLVGLELALRAIGRTYSSWRPQHHGALSGYRILTVGDSYTYGGNVSWEDSYPYRLWLKFRGEMPGKNIAVINEGHCEFNSRQVLAELGGYLDKYRPDIVVALTGSSDKWNLISFNREDANLVFRTGDEYESYLNSYACEEPRMSPADFFREMRVFKMGRTVFLNLQERFILNRRALKTARLIMDGKAPGATEEEIDSAVKAVYYASKYEAGLDLALKLLRSVKTGSDYYEKDLSYYYLLAWSFSFQNKYGADYVLAELKSIQKDRPEFASNKTFMAYMGFFMNKEKLERELDARLERNLDAMAALCREKGVKLVLLNYPRSYTAVNARLADAARRNGLRFIDNYPVFEKLTAKSGRAKYFIGDDHCSPAGYEILADNVYEALKGEIK